MSGHIINDFKDLRSLIGEITKADPAKTTYQQNAQKMGVMQEADEAKPEDDKKAKALKGRKDHAGEEEIKKAYMQLGRAAQGSVEYQRKLIQKELSKMGYKTYSKFAFDDIFKFENAQQIKREQEFKDTASQFQLESALSDMQNIVKTKGAKKIGGVMVDLFTASIITKAYDKVNDANKAKMEKANLQTLVQLAHRLMGMKEELQLDESKMGDLLIDIQMGATAKELARDHDISIGSAKDFLSQYYGNKKTRKAPGLKKEGLDEYAVLDTGLEKALKKFKVKFSKDLKDVTEGGMKQLFQDLEDGASAQQLSKKYGIDMKTAKSFVDDYKKVSQAPRLRAAQNDPLKEGTREEKLKEQKEQAEQSPFKLKSQQYPRAIAINTDGFGKRHATVEDIITACDSFGMIIDKELQVEQIQKQLGKKGFISFKQSDLEDVFDERETQRVILALETVVEEQGPIEYTRDQVEEAYIMGEEIEFLKPDGLKTAGKVLKLSGNTFNVKDKFTGKSFTYKYINEEQGVKTFTQAGLTKKNIGEYIQEAKFSKQLIKQAGGIAFDKRYYQGNMTGAIKAIEKLKKGLSDDPKVKEMLRIANESNETTDYTNWLPEGGDKEAYKKFFNAALKKFGVSSPDELEGDKKKEFFDYVDKNWKGDHEEVEQDVHKTYKMDGRRKNFKEKMRKLGYIKGR